MRLSHLAQVALRLDGHYIDGCGTLTIVRFSYAINPALICADATELIGLVAAERFQSLGQRIIFLEP